MGKRTKQAKLTEEEKERLDERFQQFRDESLRQWYEETFDDDQQAKDTAQARLYLQFGLREKRRQVMIWRQERDACKAEGDTIGLEATRKKLKQAQKAMGMHANMLRDGIPASTVAKSCRNWAHNTRSLEEVLADRDLDKRLEFGMIYYDMVDSIREEEEIGGMILESNMRDMQLEDKDTTRTVEDGDEASDSGIPTLDATSIWEQYAVHMQHRYRVIELPDYAMETKLGFQKKNFDQHVDRERQLCKALESTLSLGENSQFPTRKGISLSRNTVLATTTYFEHSLWELSSPMLWRYFQSGLSWDYPQWIPRGLMRIQTVSSSSHIYFEIGSRSFTTKSVSIPSNISPQKLTFQVQGYHDQYANIEIEVEIEITFLVEGFVRVLFPLVAILPSDVSSHDLPLAVELTGFWMGPVE